MNYQLLHDIVDLAEDFERHADRDGYGLDINGFKAWVAKDVSLEASASEPEWEGKDKGRTPESVISTLIVHMNRYARSYSKSAIHNSGFSTQEDFIYLINLNAFGEMSKMDLIKKNVHEKPAGMQIINRLIGQGWVRQRDSKSDRRSKVIGITSKGRTALEKQMDKIRLATDIVAGDLTYLEKMELIRLLTRLDRFHQPYYDRNIDSAVLIDSVMQDKTKAHET